MALGNLCAAPNCGNPAPKRGRLCPKHHARLRRGGSFEPRHPARPIFELLGGQRLGGTVLGEAKPYERRTGKENGCHRLIPLFMVWTLTMRSVPQEQRQRAVRGLR